MIEQRTVTIKDWYIGRKVIFSVNHLGHYIRQEFDIMDRNGVPTVLVYKTVWIDGYPYSAGTRVIPMGNYRVQQ